MSNQAFFDALEQFEVAPPHMHGATGLPADPPDLCAVYGRVRPIIDGLLPFIRKLPGVGPRVALAIEALMAALDIVCPRAAGAPPPALAAKFGGSDRAFFDALQAFHGSFDGQPGARVPTGLSLPDICALYKKVKPIIEGILPLLELLPGYGPTAARAVRALLAVLDRICP